MNRLIKLVYTLLLLITINKADDETTVQSLQCGTWDVFNDEKCYKVFDSKDAQNYSDAINKCKQNEASSLVTIASLEEQQYIYNLLANTHKIVNDVWIGAHYSGNHLRWTDNTTSNYTNWANGNPQNIDEYDCVQMQITEPFHGQWSNTACNKNNVVVCQRPQNWLFSYLQKTVMELREHVSNVTKKLENTDTELRNNLDNTRQELKATNTELTNTKSRLDSAMTAINSLTNELTSTKSELSNVRASIDEQIRQVANRHPVTSGLYRCYDDTNHYEHFDSLDPHCEGRHTEYLLGYLCANQNCA